MTDWDNRTAAQQYQDGLRVNRWLSDKYPAQMPLWHETVLVDDEPARVGGTTETARRDLLARGDMTILEYGRWTTRHKSQGMLVDGCPMTNLQMNAWLVADGHEAAEKYKAGECCGEMPDEQTGQCNRGLGLCPLVRIAGRIIHEETGE